MTRSYGHIKIYEKEIIKLKDQGLTHREIGKRLGFSKEQIKEFFKRYNKKQRMKQAGKAPRKRGRPSNIAGQLPPSIQRLDKLAQMRYVMASQERYIKRLEMENELMRDFLSLTERK